MTQVTFYSDSSHNYTGFRFKGHAGFAESGKDIVCAAISVLVFNTINSIEELTDDKFELKMDEKTGFIDFHFTDVISHESEILMNSLVIGIKGVKEDNEKYIQIVFKEV